MGVLLAVNEGVGLRSSGVSVAVLADGPLVGVLPVVAVLGPPYTRHPPVRPRWKEIFSIQCFKSFKLDILPNVFSFEIFLMCNFQNDKAKKLPVVSGNESHNFFNAGFLKYHDYKGTYLKSVCVLFIHMIFIQA